jgi:hypothetical protein
MEVLLFFLTSVYSADAIVASGVLPCALRKPRCSAILQGAAGAGWARAHERGSRGRGRGAARSLGAPLACSARRLQHKWLHNQQVRRRYQSDSLQSPPKHRATGPRKPASRPPGTFAHLVISPVVMSRRSMRSTSTAALLKMPPAPGTTDAAGPSVERACLAAAGCCGCS